MEIKSDQIYSLETRVSDLFITHESNYSFRTDCNGFVEDGEVSCASELYTQSQLSDERISVTGSSVSPQVTATKECIKLPAESLGLGSDEDRRFEDQEVHKLEDCKTKLTQHSKMKDGESSDLKSLEIAETEGCDGNLFWHNTALENHENNYVIDQTMDSSQDNANLPQLLQNKNDANSPQLPNNEEFDVNIPQGLDNQSDDDVNCCVKREKYFYYDTPLYEETGVWIPVSVPPMSESDHKEWSRGFGSNGGTFPEEDMGWGDLYAEDKELTMWDVVVEMLLAARGKVNGYASGDIPSISWMSGHIVEQAWKEMAQTLTEVNNDKTQKILETAPPKWLPDSSASACMLCSMRFHPIMCTRHHCRFCGGIFCSECTKGRSLLPEKFRVGDPQRVCDVCYVRLESVQQYLMNQISRAAQLPTHDLTDLSTLRSWLNFPWGQSMEYEIYKATNTICGYHQVGSLRHERSIPDAILRQAKGLAILTVMKVGVMVTYNIGTGLVIARREDGSWSPPSAVSSFGMGWGAQAGGEFTDYIIVLRSVEAVKTFSGDVHLSVGAGLSAAVGIVGRTAEAEVRAGTGGYAGCYTYSCSKGAFVGCSLEGSILTTRVQENSRFYGSQSITASDILLGSLPKPPAAATLYRALADLYQKFIS